MSKCALRFDEYVSLVHDAQLGLREEHPLLVQWQAGQGKEQDKHGVEEYSEALNLNVTASPTPGRNTL